MGPANWDIYKAGCIQLFYDKEFSHDGRGGSRSSHWGDLKRGNFSTGVTEPVEHLYIAREIPDPSQVRMSRWSKRGRSHCRAPERRSNSMNNQYQLDLADANIVFECKNTGCRALASWKRHENSDNLIIKLNLIHTIQTLINTVTGMGKSVRLTASALQP
jgi:hypothetical protein